ncbi:MAG: S-layer homology domain-containing protein [Oscillospiraceae bacterium]|nr:S-layer homology domain-containing protein [Oscillospiraceae bacterium]
MRKKLLTLLLAFSLLLSMCPAALAAEGGTRETDFFTDQPHADVNYSDMEYKHIDSAPILAEMKEIRELLADGNNAKEVEESFNKFADQFLEIVTMYQLINIKTYQDVTDEEASAELEYTNDLYMTVADALVLLIQDILESPCDEFLRKQLTEEDIEYYTGYEALTEEQKARSNQETALENEYMLAAYQVYTAEYEGKEWDNVSLAQALAAGELDQETYTTISRAIAKNQNAAIGDIYLRMVALRQEIAASYDYDNYADYAYTEIYQRDYTQQEIRAFHQAVKENIVPLYDALYELYYYESGNPVYVQDYTGDIALDMIEPYIGQLSSEMAEAFTYMRSHGLYDSGPGDTKADAGFTTMLDAYGAPFYFNAPTGDLYDFSTAIHEFGHYNNFYWQKTGWNDGSKSIDLAEVHSQGLELLFTRFYEDIFEDEDAALAVQDYLMLNLSNALISGCLYDELQQYVYAEENLTLEKINQEYCRLCKDYGLIPEDDERTEMYSWYQVPHTFTSPCYYISYAVSASGAFAFWLDAQDDYFSAVDDYLKFTALDATYGFQESFEALGMESPVDPGYVKDLGETLWEILEIDERLNFLPPEDLTGMEWFAQEVYALYLGGMIAKDENNCIRPYDRAVWDDAIALVEQLIEEAPAAKDGKAPISRGEFVRLLADELELEDGKTSPFSDTNDGAAAALAEMGVLTGYADGTFRPGQTISRGEMWVIVYRVLSSIAAELLENAAA